MAASSPGPKAETREWASQLRPRERVLPPPFRAGNARAGGHPRRERGHPCSVLQLARLSVPGEALQTPSGSVRPAAGCPLAQSSRHMKVTVTAGKLPVPKPGGPCPVLAVGSDEASSARFSHRPVPGESLGSSEEPPSTTASLRKTGRRKARLQEAFPDPPSALPPTPRLRAEPPPQQQRVRFYWQGPGRAALFLSSAAGA